MRSARAIGMLSVLSVLTSGACGSQTSAKSRLQVAEGIARSDVTLARALAPALRGHGFESEGSGYRSEGARDAIKNGFRDLGSHIGRFADEHALLAPGDVSTMRLDLTLVGAAHVEAELHEGRLLFPEAYPGVDRISVSQATSHEELFLIRHSKSSHAFSWHVALPPAVDHVETRGDGVWFLDRQGQMVLHVPKAYAIDASGARLPAELTYAPEKAELAVALPLASTTQYPVLLDPAFESYVWAEIRAPRDFRAPQMSYDEARQELFLTGNGETWTKPLGSQWLEHVVRRGIDAPSQTVYGSQVFDRARGNTLFFGGAANGTPNADTWLWDGAKWERARPASSPSQRYLHAMAYDTKRNQAVVFGGSSGTGSLGDTWVWDGQTWSEKSPATKPAARYGATFAFDSVRGQGVLFGGTTSQGAFFEDTWLWDGVTWTQAVAAVHPEGRYLGASSFDAARGKVVLYGGTTSTNALSNETWAWDGQSWKNETSPLSPPALYELALAYDAGLQRTVLLGGTRRDQNGADTLYSAAWSWDGTVWRTEGTGLDPQKAAHITAVANESAKELQVFVDRRWEDPAWAFRDNSWVQRSYLRSPAKRQGHATVYDPLRDEVLLFGGRGDSGLLSDTWVRSGGVWTKKKPTVSPPGRAGHRLAFDASRGYVLLFGGFGSGGALQDTWTWDGSTWTKRQPPLSPPPRAFFGLARDVKSGTVLLAGGTNGAAVFDDTWSWNGLEWKEQPVEPFEKQEGILLVDKPDGCRLLLPNGMQATWDPNEPRWVDANMDGPHWHARLDEAIRYDVSATAVSNGQFIFSGVEGSWASFDAEWNQFGSSNLVGPIAFSPSEDAVVSFASDQHDLPASQTWLFSLADASWNLSPDGTNYPSARALSAFDAARGQGLLVGTFEGESDTRLWTWDGNEMAELPSAQRPNFGDGPSFAFDAKRNVSVLFTQNGGQPATYTHSGNQWTLKSTPTSPSTRVGAAMVYDPIRQMVVLFGGRANGLPLQDTWLWDGSSWSLASPSTKPPPRFYHALTFYPETQSVLMFGGYGVAQALQDTWFWTGTDWKQASVRTPPLGRGGHALAALTGKKQALLVGGETLAGQPGSPWLFSSRGGACQKDDDCATGHCTDGVCCELSQCGTCESCAGSDPGRCAKVTSASDPDSCSAANKMSCDKAGSCRPGLGATCTSPSDCSSGSCVDGVCCDTACDRPCEACLAKLKGAGRDDGVCGPAIIGSNPGGKCAGASSCSAVGICALDSAQTCTEERYIDDGRGNKKDCAPYKCAGECLRACSSSRDCLFPATCTPDQKCVAPGSAPIDEGCSTRSPGAEEHPQTLSFGAVLVFFVANLRRRARTRRTTRA